MSGDNPNWLPYDKGVPDALLVKAETTEPIYSRSGECLCGGTLETWDKLPDIRCRLNTLGDLIQVGNQMYVWTGDDTGWHA